MALVLIVLAGLRLLGFMCAFGERSLQMDFSAFYTAGEAANAGLSPYQNHYVMSPPIWDGVDRYEHSRFLYPPLVAALFRPVVLLPYHVAKYLWMIVNLVALLASLPFAARGAGVKLQAGIAATVMLCVLTFHPLLPLLERGQIDGVTLLLVTVAIWLICVQRHPEGAGALIAVATLLKLHAFLIVPFLILRRQWRVLYGYGLGVSGVLGLSLVVCGPSATFQYAMVELPRILRFGEGGPSEMFADQSVLSSLIPGEGLTVKDGRPYSPSRFRFVGNASLLRTPLGQWAQEMVSALDFPGARPAVFLLIFSGFCGFLGILQWRGRIALSMTVPHEFLYWQLVCIVVLLSAPLTWVMNTVWLVALFPFAVGSLSTSQSSRGTRGVVLICLGLVGAGLPDHLSFPQLLPFEFLGGVAQHKYVLAELTVAIGIISWLRSWSGDEARVAGLLVTPPTSPNL
jgi:hypothetical protein